MILINFFSQGDSNDIEIPLISNTCRFAEMIVLSSHKFEVIKLIMTLVLGLGKFLLYISLGI